jgi:hypothetical protein
MENQPFLTERDIDDAVAAGVIETESANALKRFRAERNTSTDDGERFKVFSGFNDFFVVVASVISMGAAASIGNQIHKGLGYFLAAGVAWIVLEVFVMRRRMPFVAVVASIALVVYVFVGTFDAWTAPLNNGYQLIHAFISALLSGSVSFLCWRRFRVPICVALITAAPLAACLIGALAVVEKDSSNLMLGGLFAISGIASFVYAMWWDRTDRKRTTYRSDVAFWLHILAASLIVHSVFNILESIFAEQRVLWVSMVVLLYVVLAYVSIVVDRRALMASALIYLLIAVGKLLTESVALDVSFAVVAFIVGVMLLTLSVFWQKIRGVALRFVPDWVLRSVPLVR